MSKIAILGAGGRLGSRLVTEALALELRVNAVTHDPRKRPFSNELCNVSQANVGLV